MSVTKDQLEQKEAVTQAEKARDAAKKMLVEMMMELKAANKKRDNANAAAQAATSELQRYKAQIKMQLENVKLALRRLTDAAGKKE